MLPDSNSKGKDSVDLIRDSLFSIQVKQPWLLLQYGESDIDKLGSDRVDSLLEASPDTDDREDIVVEEIEDKDNANLSVTKTMSRLGTVVFLFIFNIGISIFVFLLTGMMIFSQVLFIIYAMFLPVSFILSMIPTYEGMAKKALTKLFNTIMLRAGITLIITTAFSISTMFYSISSGYPFFMVAFLQIVTFAGIYFKLGDLMAMFSLQSSDTQQVGRRIMRRPYMFLGRSARRLERKIGRTVAAGAAGGVAGAVVASNSRKADTAKGNSHTRPNHDTASDTSTFGKRAGAKVGAVLDGKDRLKDKAKSIRQQVKDMPTQAQYAVHSGVNQKENEIDFYVLLYCNNFFSVYYFNFRVVFACYISGIKYASGNNEHGKRLFINLYFRLLSCISLLIFYSGSSQLWKYNVSSDCYAYINNFKYHFRPYFYS